MPEGGGPGNGFDTPGAAWQTADAPAPREDPMAPDRDLGEKHACSECDTLFYDLLAEEPACPNCGAPARQQPKATPPRKGGEGAAETDAPEAIDDDGEEEGEEEESVDSGDETAKIAGGAGDGDEEE